MARAERVGITTTLPVEVLFAAGLQPVDLNNLFIASPGADAAVQRAEGAGFPHSSCAWIKGIYATVLAAGIRRVAVVTGGDCSNAVALGEVLEDGGVEVLPFAFPPRRNRRALTAEIKRFAARVGTTAGAAQGRYERLAPAREMLRALDLLTWRDGRASARENAAWHLRACDFAGGPRAFARDLGVFLRSVSGRPARRSDVRLGLVGVPPINDDLFAFLEGLGAAVVFNELPRQFALGDGGRDLADAYTRYTYPYGTGPRLADIRAAVADRRLAGVVHYVQAFCYRGIQDILIRKGLDVPVLTLEGERPGALSAQQRLRLETFVAMLRPA